MSDIRRSTPSIDTGQIDVFVDLAEWERHRVSLYRRGLPDLPLGVLDASGELSILPQVVAQGAGYVTAAVPVGRWFVHDDHKVFEVELSRSSSGERIPDCRLGDVDKPIEMTMRFAKTRTALEPGIADMTERMGLPRPAFRAGHNPVTDSFGRVGAAPMPHPKSA